MKISGRGSGREEGDARVAGEGSRGRGARSPRPLARLHGRPLLVALLSLLPAAVEAQPADDGATLDVSGFIGATLYAQNRLFAPGNGQQAQTVPELQDGPAGWWHGGDIRNTRLTVEFAAPLTGGGWRAGGVFELDFFGGITEGSGFDQEQLLPRLRLLLARTEWRGPAVGEAFDDRVRTGQQFAFSTLLHF